jgi:hypothetical protein
VRADSSVVLRYAGAGAPADTLVRRLAALVSMVSGQPPRMIPTALWPHSLVLTFPDGWVSVAHADPYRTEWNGPGGERVIGDVLPVESEAWDEDIKAAILSRAGWSEAGDLVGQFARYSVVPERVPPFLTLTDRDRMGTAVQHVAAAAPDGRLILRRTVLPAADSAHYDVIDRAWRLSARFSLHRSEFILGTGASSLYVVRTDSLGFQHLRRVPWALAPGGDEE